MAWSEEGWMRRLRAEGDALARAAERLDAAALATDDPFQALAFRRAAVRLASRAEAIPYTGLG
ncbi:hypothetical protein FBZ88_12969 [Nitrospirillum bahiense]|uniref:HEPN domain-containing protein n=2 Tax=Nitrospirillum amazonense TaxID=28077 RepID=A0A560F1X0_9PROT|nr:hypothetical protein FBZ88_12969 [Nitrospirillum amazonense]